MAHFALSFQLCLIHRKVQFYLPIFIPSVTFLRTYKLRNIHVSVTMSYLSVHKFPVFSEHILINGHLKKKLTFGVLQWGSCTVPWNCVSKKMTHSTNMSYPLFIIQVTDTFSLSGPQFNVFKFFSIEKRKLNALLLHC